MPRDTLRRTCLWYAVVDQVAGRRRWSRWWWPFLRRDCPRGRLASRCWWRPSLAVRWTEPRLAPPPCRRPPPRQPRSVSLAGVIAAPVALPSLGGGCACALPPPRPPSSLLFFFLVPVASFFLAAAVNLPLRAVTRRTSSRPPISSLYVPPPWRASCSPTPLCSPRSTWSRTGRTRRGGSRTRSLTRVRWREGGIPPTGVGGGGLSQGGWGVVG